VNRYLCPPGAVFAAYQAGLHYFPPNHPLHPLGNVQPDACFRTAAEARAAGYSLALPPQGVFAIDGVYLGEVALPGCPEAAEALRFPVPCPGLLPNPDQDVGPPDCNTQASFGLVPTKPCVSGEAFLFQYMGFAVPPDYGVAVGGGPSANLVITALIEPRPTADSELPYFLTCPDASPVGRTEFSPPYDARVIQARYFLCPDYPPPQSGQLILRWSIGKVTYSVSLHGDTPTNRTLLVQIASSIHYVPPPGQEP
jgi:hypothetical protein